MWIKPSCITASDVLPDVFGLSHSDNDCANGRIRQDVAQSHLRQRKATWQYLF
jgi:hypothetical protein